jgi:hypothetical protein
MAKKEMLRQLHQRPIAYYPLYRRITGSTAAAVALSQIMYWASKADVFYKTDADLLDETQLTVNELRSAKRKIKALDFISITVQGVPAKTVYRIDWEKYESSLVNFTEQAALNSLSCDSGNNESINDQTFVDYAKTTHRESQKPLASDASPSFSDDDLEIAKLLYSKLKDIFSGMKKPNFKKWAEHVLKMREIDGRSEENIRHVIAYVFEDKTKHIFDGTFWRSNVRSTESLRKHYDTIALQVNTAVQKFKEAK